jgi:hypothetical protein
MGKLPKWFTPEWLEKSTLEQRHTAWRNAREKGGPEGDALAEAIKASGLPYVPPGYLSMDDPRVIRMHEIVNSPDARKRCQAAVEAGQPALAGVESDLQSALGPDYCGENGATMTAGAFVAEVMRSQGYVDAGQRQMPEGSTAKTARFFTRR